MDPKASIIPFLAFFTVFVMIDELLVRNIALISDAQISFAPGLTALTGETGAGKTALLSALKLLMGERADSSCVREGEAGALVQGRLYRSDADVEGFVVERRLSADGRSRVKIDGSLASVSELASQVRPLVDICGQHEHQHLLDTAYHLTMVDTWSRDTIAPAHAAYIAAFREHKRQLREYEELERAARTQGSRLEEARFCVERIEEVDPKPGELEELEEILPRAEHAEALATSANDAQEYLSGEGGALDTLNSAIAELSRMGSVDTALAGFADELSGAAITMEDAAAELRRYRDSVDFDPADLASKHERLGALNALKRQFGPSMDDVFERYRQSSELLSLVNDSDARLARAKRLVDDSERILQDAAKKLARRRAAAGPRFCREVGKQLARLEMGSAELVWQVRDLDRKAWTESGSCSYELLYRSGAGLTPRPLRRVASGGELSRVMLACSVVLGEADGVSTMVFDEIDAGVGGATARSLASVLSDLARTHQVIVVTHTAQIAVAASRHYLVTKNSGAEVPVTSIAPITGDGRIEEIARMLSGDTEQVSIDHARALLEEAGTLD